MADAKQQPFVADKMWLTASDMKQQSSVADSKQQSFAADTKQLSAADTKHVVDAKRLFHVADTKQQIPAADTPVDGIASQDAGVAPFVASGFHPHLVVVMIDKHPSDAQSVQLPYVS